MPGKEIGLGVVNPRQERIETPAEIVRRVEAALAVVPAGALFLNPDCGFGSFAARPMNDAAVVSRKLAAMGEAARRVRGEEPPRDHQAALPLAVPTP